MLEAVDNDVFLHADRVVFGPLVDVVAFLVGQLLADELEDDVRHPVGDVLPGGGTGQVNADVGDAIVIGTGGDPAFDVDDIDDFGMLFPIGTKFTIKRSRNHAVLSTGWRHHG